MLSLKDMHNSAYIYHSILFNMVNPENKASPNYPKLMIETIPKCWASWLDFPGSAPCMAEPAEFPSKQPAGALQGPSGSLPYSGTTNAPKNGAWRVIPPNKWFIRLVSPRSGVIHLHHLNEWVITSIYTSITSIYTSITSMGYLPSILHKWVVSRTSEVGSSPSAQAAYLLERYKHKCSTIFL